MVAKTKYFSIVLLFLVGSYSVICQKADYEKMICRLINVHSKNFDLSKDEKIKQLLPMSNYYRLLNKYI
jgi:hypothetical protein